MHKTSFATLCLALGLCAPALAAQIEPVAIKNYTGEAMEPFISRDGRFLFFNTRNDPGQNTNIHFAEWQMGSFHHRGVLPGTESAVLDATPTMSANGRFCFISVREYRQTLRTVFCGEFDGQKVGNVKSQPGLAGARLGRLTFDVELSADGNILIFAEGTFSGGDVPDDAGLHLAAWSANGFKRLPVGKQMLANINTPELEFAPALSANGLELYFTRPTGFWIFRSPKIFRATRSNTTQPFGVPVELTAADGFVEGPTLAPDGTLYFHKRVNDHYQIWRLSK